MLLPLFTSTAAATAASFLLQSVSRRPQCSTPGMVLLPRGEMPGACIVPRLAHVRVLGQRPLFRGPPSSGRFCCERGGLWWIYAPACPRPRCRPPSSPRPSSRRRGAERAGRPSRRGAHHRFGRDRLPSRGPRLEAAVPARIVYCIRCGPRWHAIRGLRTSKK